MIRKDKRLPFIIAASFLSSVVLIRLAVWLAGSAESDFATAAKAGALPDTQFYIGSNIILFGYHIHHFYFGILLLCVAGWLAIVGSQQLSLTHAAVLYGTGLGLFLDEIGLLLTWGDYHSNLTYIWVLIVLGLFMNIIFFDDFWRRAKKSITLPRQQSFIFKPLKKGGLLFTIIDSFAAKLSDKAKTRLLFTSVVYVTIGLAILLLPVFIHYFVAAGMLFLGGQLIIRSFTKQGGETMSFSEGINQALLGVLYVIAGIAILLWPAVLYYAVATIFIIQGIVLFIKSFTKQRND